MASYNLIIRETLEREVIIKARSFESAFQKAEDMCNSGEIDLDGDDFVSRDIERA